MTSGALTLWLADHPRFRRTVVAMTLTHALSVVALACAPRAVAAGGSAALGWTGLHDTDGVPIAYYFLSMVSVPEAAINNDQDVSVIDPSTWMKWMAAAMERAVDNATAAWWLGWFAGAFVFVMAVALWFLRFALSTGWLVAIATVGLPLYHAVNGLVSQMMLGAIAVTICVMVAGYHIVTHNAGRGWAMLGTALLLTVLLATVFSDPVGDLYSEHGLLALGRGTGLEIAQAATGAPFAAGASLDAKLDALMSNVVTAGVRHPLQVLNFGMVVDDISACRQAWSGAMMAAQGVDGSGPAHAMSTCGAPQALAYAQRLGGYDATIGLVLVAVAVVVGFFFWYVGLSVMVVGIKSLYFGILIGPTFLIGMMGFGRALAFAKHCGTELFMHVIQLMVFEVYLAVSAIGLTWVLTTNMLGASTATALPRILIMAVAAAALWLGFRIVDRSFHTDGMGTIGRQIRGAWHAGTGTVREEAATYRDGARRIRDGATGLHRRFGGRGDDTNGQQADENATGSRALPGMEWFKPRSTRPTPNPQTQTGNTPSPAAPDGTGSSSTSGAKSAAKGLATTATVAAVKVAAPEVAAPVTAAAKAAGVAGHVIKSGQNATSAPSTPSTQPNPGDGGTGRPRTTQRTSAASPELREPAQASMIASRTGRTTPRDSVAPSSPAGDPKRAVANQDRTARAPLESGEAPQSRPRPPREIGS